MDDVKQIISQQDESSLDKCVGCAAGCEKACDSRCNLDSYNWLADVPGGKNDLKPAWIFMMFCV